MADGTRPQAGGWNRIHFVTHDLDAEIARLQGEGVPFRNAVVTGPGGSPVLAVDPSGILIELFAPATR
jgi:predicted enzyme related to lactoylglutathione lyase